MKFVQEERKKKAEICIFKIFFNIIVYFSALEISLFPLNDDKMSTRVVLIICFCPTELQYYTYNTKQILIWNNIKINAQ